MGSSEAMQNQSSQLTRFGVSVPDKLASEFDLLIKRKGYKTRSEALADLMRASLVEQEWSGESGEVIGTVTIVYDHHKTGLTDELNAIQHAHHEIIVAATHVHVNHHTCLEVIILRGDVATTKSIADRLIAATGVKHGKFVCTTTASADFACCTKH